MPLGPLEQEVLRVLASNRNPDSFVAGATVLNQSPDSPRASQDIDLFHDTIEALRVSVELDMASLRRAGFEATLVTQHDTFCRARVQRGESTTKIEWVNDSAYRFFPIEPDAELGWRLNFWDAATNKVLAGAGRAVARDFLDMVWLHQRHLSLGALVWAAAAKDPGLSPEMIVDMARRHAKYRQEELDAVRPVQPINVRELKQIFLQAADEAEALFKKLPAGEMGCFYLDAQRRPVCPDPAAPGFAALTRHYGSVKGAWPRIAEE